MIHKLKNLPKAGSIVNASLTRMATMYYPDLKEVQKLSTEGNTIPIYKEIMADMETAVSAFYKVAYDANGNRKPFSYLLESVEGGENIGRYSFIGVDPLAIFRQNGDHAEVEKAGEIVAEYRGSDCFLPNSNLTSTTLSKFLSKVSLLSMAVQWVTLVSKLSSKSSRQ